MLPANVTITQPDADWVTTDDGDVNMAHPGHFIADSPDALWYYGKKMKHGDVDREQRFDIKYTRGFITRDLNPSHPEVSKIREG